MNVITMAGNGLLIGSLITHVTAQWLSVTDWRYMTRQHFVLIAQAMNDVMPPKGEWEFYHQWERDVFSLAEALARTNKQFDRERFIHACKEIK